MKAKITFLCLLAFSCFIPKAAAQCTNGTLYPSTTFTPACSNTYETIVTNAWAGQYANVNVVSNNVYTFMSSVSADYVTITNEDAGVVLAHGPSPLVWVSGTTFGTVRYYLHTSANCGSLGQNRTRYVKCTAAPVCGNPTALSASAITSNSARLNWTPPSPTPSSYDLYIVTTNTAPVDATPATVTSNTAGVGVLSGLAASTTYYYWIRSNCGVTKGAWVSGGSFATIAALTCNGAANGLYPDATFTPSCSGSNETIVNDAYAGEFANVNYLSGKQYTFTSSVATDYITITNATGTTVLASGTTPVTWNSGASSGVLRYYFHSDPNCGAQTSLRVKYIKCVNAPANCNAPTSFTISNITSNSVRMNWVAPTPAPVSYDVHCITSFTPPSDNQASSITTMASGITCLNGLSPATTYHFWVRSFCGGTTTSSWSYGGTFTTNAALNCNGAYYGLYPEQTFTPSCTGTVETIVNDAYAGEFSKVNVTSNKQYSFFSSVTTDFLTITNITGTTVLASGQTPVYWNSGNFSGQIRYFISSNGNCGTQASNRVKSIACSTIQANCGAPSFLQYSNVTSNSVRLFWTAPEVAPDYYDIYVSQSNAVYPEYNTQPTGNSAGYIRSYYAGLFPSTTYYFWVRSVCNNGNQKSDWMEGGSFTTLPNLQCNGASFGLYPEDTMQLENTGNPEIVALEGKAGEYTNVAVANNKQYTFTSSNPEDFLTITNAEGTQVLVSGTTPVTWTSGNMATVVRFYLHANANCTDDDAPRVRYVTGSTLGLEDLSERQVAVYPNPTAGRFTVETGGRIADAITIHDNLGRVVGSYIPTASQTNLTLNGLAEGVYYVRIKAQGTEVTKKLVLKK